jgi:hypothetical protein
LFSLLIPHLGYLIVAIVSALATAYLNIEIPQSLGRIVNVVASFVGTGDTSSQYVTLLRKIVMITSLFKYPFEIIIIIK